MEYCKHNHITLDQTKRREPYFLCAYIKVSASPPLPLSLGRGRGEGVHFSTLNKIQFWLGDTIYQCIYRFPIDFHHQTTCPLIPNQSENCKYNQILFPANKELNFLWCDKKRANISIQIKNNSNVNKFETFKSTGSKSTR